MRLLVAVALRQEAAHLHDIDGIDVALTGAGKVSAAVAVSQAITEGRPSAVLNVGTAGALRPGLGGLYRIGRVAEHDFDVAALERLTGDTFPGELELDASADTVLVTGDVFVQDEALRARLAERAHLVDMEGYAVARACAAFGVPCTMLKVVSDEASAGAVRSWVETIDESARRIAQAVRGHLDDR
jgi:adenosylhomocysteine nucleosidase